MSKFSQKILVIVAAITIVSGGLWYLQREWISEDPDRIKVDPEVRERVLALLERSKTARFDEKMAILYDLRAIGRESVPVLVQALLDDDPETRAFAANVLRYSRNPSVIPHLQARLNDESAQVRKSALLALGGLGAVEAVPAIVLVLDDEDNFTRCQAAHVLGILKEDGAVIPLIEILEKDPYPVARQTAANSLGEIGSEKAVRPLINSLEDKDYKVRSASMVALNRITGAELGSQKTLWLDWWRRNHPSTPVE